MRTSLGWLLVLMHIMVKDIFAQVGFEQYSYIMDKEVMTLAAIFNYEAINHTYVEARYNYEDINTFSFYMGRVLSGKKELTYSVTPMLGGVVGKFDGGSAAVNAVLEYKKFFFSTQSQYTLSFQELRRDFFFSWSDIGYQPCEWFYLGVSTQYTYLPQTKFFLSEPGILLGFTVQNWTFPLYWFNPVHDSTYFVFGVNYSIGALKRNK